MGWEADISDRHIIICILHKITGKQMLRIEHPPDIKLDPTEEKKIYGLLWHSFQNQSTTVIFARFTQIECAVADATNSFDNIAMIACQQIHGANPDEVRTKKSGRAQHSVKKTKRNKLHVVRVRASSRTNIHDEYSHWKHMKEINGKRQSNHNGILNVAFDYLLRVYNALLKVFLLCRLHSYR